MRALPEGLIQRDRGADRPKCVIRWDNMTRTWAQARSQALAIAKEARRLLDEQGWHIMEQEEVVDVDDLTGTFDLRCWKEGEGEAIIDLKTGQHVGAAWLQVGGYIFGLENREKDSKCYFGAASSMCPVNLSA